MSNIPAWLSAAREHWKWSGSERPPFAATPGPGQTSVWDFPRPPRLAVDHREIIIRWGAAEVARTRNAVSVLETSHPPSFYIPPQDITPGFLQAAPGSSFCEWKGPAKYWSLVDDDRILGNVAWSYPNPMEGAEALKDFVAFYCRDLECRVDGELALPQPGGFYGGWVTPELVGPFKGEPGTSGW